MHTKSQPGLLVGLSEDGRDTRLALGLLEGSMSISLRMTRRSMVSGQSRRRGRLLVSGHVARNVPW